MPDMVPAKGTGNFEYCVGTRLGGTQTYCWLRFMDRGLSKASDFLLTFGTWGEAMVAVSGLTKAPYPWCRKPSAFRAGI